MIACGNAMTGEGRLWWDVMLAALDVAPYVALVGLAGLALAGAVVVTVVVASRA